jgi:hypothetical protein
MRPRRVNPKNSHSILISVTLFFSAQSLYAEDISIHEAAPQGEKPVVVRSLSVPTPDLEIDGIIYDERNPLAMINGDIFAIGAEVEGVRIVNIYETSVEFEYNGQTFSKRVGSGKHKSSSASVSGSKRTRKKKDTSVRTRKSVKKPARPTKDLGSKTKVLQGGANWDIIIQSSKPLTVTFKTGLTADEAKKCKNYGISMKQSGTGNRVQSPYGGTSTFEPKDGAIHILITNQESFPIEVGYTKK